jgi:hypothetical protein
MTRTIEFRVEGELPPKKDGANSMWGKSSEQPRLVALRRAALSRRGDAPPLTHDIRLLVEIHCPARDVLRAGDLDNFITGICDGLMAAARGTPSDSWWDAPEMVAIAPSKCIAILDDNAIMEIVARKVAVESEEPSYHVVLTGD